MSAKRKTFRVGRNWAGEAARWAEAMGPYPRELTEEAAKFAAEMYGAPRRAVRAFIAAAAHATARIEKQRGSTEIVS